MGNITYVYSNVLDSSEDTTCKTWNYMEYMKKEFTKHDGRLYTALT